MDFKKPRYRVHQKKQNRPLGKNQEDLLRFFLNNPGKSALLCQTHRTAAQSLFNKGLLSAYWTDRVVPNAEKTLFATVNQEAAIEALKGMEEK